MDKSDPIDNNTFEKDLINKRLDRNDWNSVEIAVDYNTKLVYNTLTSYVSTKFEPTKKNILDSYKINILEKEPTGEEDKSNSITSNNIVQEEYELPDSWEDEIKVIEKVHEVEPENKSIHIKKTKKTIQLKNNSKNNSTPTNINKDNTSSVIKEDTINEKSLGEESYLIVRKYISDTKLGLINNLSKSIINDSLTNDDTIVITKKVSKKPKPIKLSSAEKIKKDLSDKRLIEATKQLISEFEENNELNYDMYIKDGFLPKLYIEFTGLTFMHCANILITMSKSDKYKKLTHKREYYELIISIQKFISNVKNTKCLYFLDSNQTINISSTLLLDLENWLNKLMTLNDFDGLTLIKTNPELVYRTKYDKCFSSSMATKKIRLRPSQIQLIDFLVENYTDNFLIEYCSGVGSGKTTLLATAIPMFVREYNSVNQYNKKIALLCCTSIVVKRDMANIAYNAGIHFAMGVQDNLYSNTKSNYRITYQHNSSPDNLEAIICTAECAYSLLMEEEKNKENGGRNKYILLFDEPTMGADQPNSDTLRDCMKLFSVLPNQSILSSATMCELSSLPDFIKDINIKHTNLRTINIRDSNIQIGCTISTFDNILVLPHNGCTNSNNLKICIDTISKNSFLCRMYTIQVAGFLYNLTKKFNKINQKDLPDIKLIFKNINNLESNKVVKICLDILNKVCDTQDNKLIYDFCNVEYIEEKIIDNELDKEMLLETNFEHINSSNNIHTIFKNIGRTEAYKYTNMNLIVDTNPIEFEETYFKDLIDELYIQIHSCSNIISKYKALQKKFNDEKDLIEKTIKSEDERIKKYNVLIKSEPFLCMPQDNNQSSKSLFPSYFQINTKDHMQHYSPHSIKNDNVYRISLPLEHIPFDDFSLPDWIIACLFCGIGIYSPNNIIFKNNHAYNQTILQLASKGQLAYLISDYSICYGTNYPIYRVFITDNFSNICSVNTLFQVLGRTGRVGKSWIGSAYLSNNAARKLIKSVQDDKDISNKLEPINMQNMLNRILSENIEEHNKTNNINSIDYLENHEDKKDLGIRLEFNPIIKQENIGSNSIQNEIKQEKPISVKKSYIPPYLLQTNIKQSTIKPDRFNNKINRDNNRPNQMDNNRPNQMDNNKLKDNSKESWARV